MVKHCIQTADATVENTQIDSTDNALLAQRRKRKRRRPLCTDELRTGDVVTCSVVAAGVLAILDRGAEQCSKATLCMGAPFPLNKPIKLSALHSGVPNNSRRGKLAGRKQLQNLCRRQANKQCCHTRCEQKIKNARCL